MKYVQLKFIKTVSMLKKLELDFVLEDYPKTDALPAWWDTGEDKMKSKIPKGYKKQKIGPIGIFTGGRLYREEAMAYVRGNIAYINENTYFNLF